MSNILGSLGSFYEFTMLESFLCQILLTAIGSTSVKFVSILGFNDSRNRYFFKHVRVVSIRDNVMLLKATSIMTESFIVDLIVVTRLIVILILDILVSFLLVVT